MKKLTVWMLVLSVSATCVEAKSIFKHKHLEIMQKQDREAIEALLQRYKKSLNTSDAPLAQSLYTKDGIFMPTEAPSAIGRESILKSYEFIFIPVILS